MSIHEKSLITRHSMYVFQSNIFLNIIEIMNIKVCISGFCICPPELALPCHKKIDDSIDRSRGSIIYCLISGQMTVLLEEDYNHLSSCHIQKLKHLHYDTSSQQIQKLNVIKFGLYMNILIVSSSFLLAQY